MCYGVSLGSGWISVISDEACFGLSVIWAGLEGVKGGSDSQRVLLVCVSYRSDYSYQSYTSAL